VAAQASRERKKVSPPSSAPAAVAARPSGRLWLLLLIAYPILVLIGFALLQRPGVMVEGQQLSEVRAIMIASSTLTLTGFQFAVGPNEFNPESIQGPAIILTLTMAGTLRGEVNLAAANGLYLVLLLLGGMVIPIDELPTGLQVVARALPAGALSDALHGSLTAGGSVPARAWLVLLGWAVVAPVVAALTFRWE